MTTPAVNQNRIIYGKTQQCDRSSANPNTVCSPINNVGQAVEWTSKTRPASSTVPIDPITGWRACRGWSHSGRFQSRSESGNVTIRRDQRDYPGQSKPWQETDYRYGSFWRTYAPAALPVTPSGLISEAEIKALNRLKDTEVNLGAYLAEGKQTVSMVGNAAFSIYSQVRSFKRNFPKLWKQVKQHQTGNLRRSSWHCIPDKWLEIQYGWRPLLSDIWGAAMHLSKRGRFNDTTELLINVRGKAEREEVLERTLVAVSTTTSCKIEQSVKHSARVKLWYRMNNAILAELSTLGLINPVEIIWEAVPYSHVVDWVIPVGRWLSSLSGDTGFSFKGGSCTVKSTCSERVVQTNWERDFISGSGPTKEWRTTSGTPLSLKGEAFRFTRTCYTTSPVPGIYFKNPISLMHMLNGLAMLTQVFRRN